MPDINPAELSRAAISLSTPTLATKSLAVGTPSTNAKPLKNSQIIPARIDLEPIYTALKAAIGNEQWVTYKESLTQFFIGRLNQAEFSERIDPIITSPNGEKEHLHNQLLAALYANVTREMPDPGPAPWVSANDKPTSGAGSKPVSGDAAERRLKADVMALPSRDRRRLKDLQQNEVDPHHSLADLFSEHHRSKRPRLPVAAEEAVPSVGLNMNREQDIRKRVMIPLSVESGEFPEIGYIESRLLPLCYESGLESAAPDCAQLVSAATEQFIKEVVGSIFSRTRSNGPGESGSAGFGSASAWIQTHKYKKQLSKEEEAAQRGEATRDKCGLLPVESKAASERGPLAMGDLHLALDVSDCGMAQFPVLVKGLLNNYRDGELENLGNYTYLDGFEKKPFSETDVDIVTPRVDKGKQPEPANGFSPDIEIPDLDEMDVDHDYFWSGSKDEDTQGLDAILDSALAL